MKPINISLGKCPTNQHTTNASQCGFIGCVNLKAWAEANRYRYRLEESYKAESNMHIKGDGRWYAEVLCRSGFIYSYGGTDLLAYAKPGRAVKELSTLWPEVTPHQTDGKARVFKFPIRQLNAVAKIMSIKRRRTISPEQADILRERLKTIAGKRKTAQI